MSERLRVPGPSFLRERGLRLHPTPDDPGRPVVLGMGQPSTTDDGWWLAHLWVADDGWIVDAREVAPPAGPPPTPPPMIMGPVFAGALAGLIAEANGRQLVRLRLHPAGDPARPWERPLVLQVAIRWDPVRAALLRPTELAVEVLGAWARAVEACGRPV